MWHSAEFKKKVLSATPLYATQCEIQVKNFLVDSGLCGTAGSRLRAMPHSGELGLHAMQHSTELRLRPMPHSGELQLTLCRIARSRNSSLCSRFSLNLIEYLREFESICKTVLAHESGDPGVQFIEKTEGRKSRIIVTQSILQNIFGGFFSSVSYFVCIMIQLFIMSKDLLASGCSLAWSKIN
jgi:hypothetical protein